MATHPQRILPTIERNAARLPVPRNYFEGLEAEWEWGINRVLAFSRLDRDALQRKTIESSPHHRHVLACCLRTGGTVGLDHRPVPLRPGEGVLVLPYQFHHYYGLESARLCWLFVTFESPAKEVFEVFRNRRLEFDEDGLVHLGRIAAWSLRPGGPDTGRRLVDELQCLLGNLRHGVLARGRPRAARHGQAGGSIVERVQRALAGGADGIRELAQAMALSEGRLRALFRAQTGTSLGSYLRQQRLHRAMAAMADPRLALYQVAEASGYSSLAAFSRSFKSLVGMGPRAYRKRNWSRVAP